MQSSNNYNHPWGSKGLFFSVNRPIGQVSLLLYSGLFSRGVYFVDFAERAQFANFETMN
jgi:hypothetical protein